MIISTPPKLPIANYKWRWASVAPTEGLNEPSVYLGVLRALCKHEGKSPADAGLLADLKIVQDETRTRVNLVRTPERNLMRNSGQYWKALGLLGATEPAIVVTEFGRQVCRGEVTPSQFSAVTVATLTLPNTRVQDDVGEWHKAKVSLKPLALLLQVISELAKKPVEGYLTESELIRIVIPASAITTNPRDHSDTILAHRSKKISVAGWPNCVPSANDPRMAMEFILFLTLHGYLAEVDRPGWVEPRYYIQDIAPEDVESLQNSVAPAKTLDDAVDAVKKSTVPERTDRQRILREILNRPQQQKFRKEVFVASGATCLFTGTTMLPVLEAAHIIPISRKGSDNPRNGLCLRSDVHILFDAGHVRLRPSGELVFSPETRAEAVYKGIPPKIAIPAYVDVISVAWRWKYV